MSVQIRPPEEDGIGIARSIFSDQCRQFENRTDSGKEIEMEITSAADQKLDFMTLLVTELQNQNPLEPMDNQQMAAQLAQFTQLELSEKMNTNLETINETIGGMNLGFQGAMLMAQVDYAKSLLGHDISFYSETYQKSMNGSVQKIQFEEGEPVLSVKTQTVNPDQSVSEQTVLVKLEEITGINV
jgi:flagellar basal-body rod modification protein FlgD